LLLCLRRHVRRRRSGFPVFILRPRYRLHRLRPFPSASAADRTLHQYL
jgi:hypothetical protein